jgi:hypothetical protein
LFRFKTLFRGLRISWLIVGIMPTPNLQTQISHFRASTLSADLEPMTYSPATSARHLVR